MMEVQPKAMLAALRFWARANASGEVEIDDAKPSDCAELAPLLRLEDAQEVEAGGETVLGALQSSLASSSAAYAIRFDGELGALCGVVPLDNGAGAAWCLTGRAVAKHKKAFLRASPVVLAGLLAVSPVLVAAVDARYIGALRWVRWLGFEVGEAQPFGPQRFLFHLATRRESWV